MSQHVAISRKRLAKHAQDVALNKVAIYCVQMLRSFGRSLQVEIAIKVFEYMTATLKYSQLGFRQRYVIYFLTPTTLFQYLPVIHSLLIFALKKKICFSLNTEICFAVLYIALKQNNKTDTAGGYGLIKS